MPDIFFEHPLTLFERVRQVLERVGPDKFFSGPDEDIKKAREGFWAYFFTLTLKKFTGRDWWFAQFDQAERQYPDFDLMSFSSDSDDIGMEQIELTGVYPHFKTFDEAMKVIEKKQKQYGDKKLKFSLLIHVNHEKSEEWVQLLTERLVTNHPFVSIWTLHLRFKPGGQEVKKVVAQRIMPTPWLRVEVDMDDLEIFKPQAIPTHLHVKTENGRSHVTFKPEFIEKFLVKRQNSL